ncbi:MAG TPA: DegT/DnrJ/EryC1/StrS family aminotransferase [Mariprofundaceae bacterium]|nr:DegT/DnrJ/EryC1/StrS family aminotransferase [Mariprofundaceae bacterium]
MLEVLESGHTAMGDAAARLEHEIAARLECKHAVAVDSGTSAIMLALRALRLECRITRVGLPAYCCSSVLYAVRAAGMEPVLMDCAADLRLDAGRAMKLAGLLDAVVLVHPFGMVESLAAEAWPCVVIEDIAQSAGAEWQGRPLGSFGDAAIASFHATKPWGGAYGGAVACNEADAVAAIREMRNPDLGDGDWPEYAGHHQLSDLHAALALQRMTEAGGISLQRRRWATTMDGWFAGKGSQPVRRDGNDFRYIVRTPGQAGAVIRELRRHGVGAARPVAGIFPGEQAEACPGALAAWQDCVSLPLLADFSEEEFLLMEQAVRACMP